MQYINRKHRKLLSKYNHTMEERQLFMIELKKMRGDSRKECRKEIRKNVGPTWYQVLSVHHRTALDTLDRAIYQDIIEGLPIRTMKIIRILGIIPLPDKFAVQHCMYLGRNDCKVFLAQLFLTMYDHPISSKRYSYDLNMRMILSSIYYLGLDDLIRSLQEEFEPDQLELQSPPEPKKKRPPAHVSPYLQEMGAPLYQPATPKRKPPPPLPDLSFLNQDFEEELASPIIKPPPPPPPPPPPKKTLPRGDCDKLAGIISFKKANDEPKPLRMPIVTKKPQSYRRLRSSKMSLNDTKKKYGIGNVRGKRKKKQGKPKPPLSGLSNVQYNIVGVHTYKGNSYFINGGVNTLPPQGTLMNGGHVLFPNGEYGLMNMGFAGGLAPPSDDSCECLEKWDSAVLRHVKNTKCYCDHRCDYGNEGTFSENEVPYFIKPTRKGSMQFNYNAIYEMDPMMMQVHKEAKKIWETESVLQEDDESDLTERRKKKKKKKEALKLLSHSQVMKKSCLRDKPELADYLRCGIRLLGRMNVAARLPDIHLAPELKEWMRFRVYGPYTIKEKEQMLNKSISYWSNFKSFQDMGLGKAKLPSDPSYSAQTTWKYKLDINKKFKKVVSNYQVKMYKAQAHMNNLLWATAYNAEYPDEKFREIFFTYLAGRVEDVVIYHPYCRYETAARGTRLKARPYSSSSNGNQNC